MLEGLEVSEIALSEAYLANDDFRFDSEFYSQDNLKKQDAVKKHIYKPLSSLCSLIAGPFGSAITSENYDTDCTCRYIRAKDIKSFFVDNTDPVFIKHSTFDEFPQFHLKENDILLTVVGMNFGKAAIIFKEDCPAVFSCKSTLIRNPSVNTWYLLAYLSSSIGHGLVRRGQRGAAQPGINLLDIENVLVPIFNNDFQQRIEALVRRSRSFILSSHTSLHDAESLLFNTLDMANFLPSTDGINIKSFKDSFIATGRLDAEAYQPKYDQLRDALESYSGGVTTIGVLAGQIANGAEVREYQEEGVAYLRVGDLKDLTIDALSVVRIDPKSAEKGLEKIALQAGDVLVSRSGSLAVTAVVEPEWADALISSHLIRLRITDKRIDSYYLALFLGAMPGKMQIQQRSNGGVQPEINQPALKSILVPIPPQKAQQEIRRLILLARKLRDSSNDLLDIAKRAVEIAIEQDEQAALEFIAAREKNNTNCVGEMV